MSQCLDCRFMFFFLVVKEIVLNNIIWEIFLKIKEKKISSEAIRPEILASETENFRFGLLTNGLVIPFSCIIVKHSKKCCSGDPRGKKTEQRAHYC